MEILYEQKNPDPVFPQTISILYWNTRGRVVICKDDVEEKKVVERGFVPLNKEERKRFEPGDFNPLYDRGDGNNKPNVSRLVFGSGAQMAGVLEVIEL